MARKFTASKEQLRPDPRFGSKLVSKFVNCLMHDGKKSVALKVFYDSMDLIERRRQAPELDPMAAAGGDRQHPLLAWRVHPPDDLALRLAPVRG